MDKKKEEYVEICGGDIITNDAVAKALKKDVKKPS